MHFNSLVETSKSTRMKAAFRKIKNIQSEIVYVYLKPEISQYFVSTEYESHLYFNKLNISNYDSQAMLIK